MRKDGMTRQRIELDQALERPGVPPTLRISNVSTIFGKVNVKSRKTTCSPYEAIRPSLMHIIADLHFE